VQVGFLEDDAIETEPSILSEVDKKNMAKSVREK
jgi:hypothetical protein